MPSLVYILLLLKHTEFSLLLMECLFKAAHARPNIFYVNSSWPWSCDMVERYIASKLLLIIIIALTFGYNLHFFKVEKIKVVIPVILPLPLTFLNG